MSLNSTAARRAVVEIAAAGSIPAADLEQLLDEVLGPQIPDLDRSVDRTWRITSIEATDLWGITGTRKLQVAPCALLAVLGPNGSGKSSLVGAVALALLGAAFSGGSAGIIRTGATKAVVLVGFELGGAEFSVERSWSGQAAKQRAVLRKDGEPIATTPTEVTSRLSALLGDGALAAASWLSAQGDSARFANAEPKDRFALLGKLFGLDAFAGWQGQLHAAARSAREQLHRLEGASSALDAAPAIPPGDPHYASSTRDELSALQAQLEARITQLDARAALVTHLDRRFADRAAASRKLHAEREARASQLEAAASQAQRDRAAFAAQVQAIDAELPALDQQAALHQQQLDTGNHARRGAHARHEAAVQTVHAADARIAALDTARAQLQQHGGGACSTCGQALDAAAAGHRLHALEDASRAAQADADAAAAATAEASTAAAAVLRDIEDATSALASIARRRDTAHAQRAAAVQALAQLSTRDDAALGAEAAALRQQAAADSAAAEAAAVLERQTALDELPPDSDGAATLRAQSAALAAELHRRAIAAQLQASTSAKAAELRAQTRLQTARLQGLEALDGACGRSGAPARLLGEQIDRLNEQIAAQLRRCGTPLRLRIEIGQELGNGRIAADKAVLIATTPGGVEVPYQSLSGGQRFLTDLALRIALTELAGELLGAAAQHLIVDEGWGVLDPENTDLALRLLDGHRQRGNSIIAVTHAEAIAEHATEQLKLPASAPEPVIAGRHDA